MMKRNVYVGITLTVASVLVLLFQNCGQSNNGQAPVANGKIVVDDFLISDTDCSSTDACKVTVVKAPKKSVVSSDNQPGVEYDFSQEKASLLDEDIPTEFYKTDSETGAYQKCVFVNRRDDIRFEYLCSK